MKAISFCQLEEGPKRDREEKKEGDAPDACKE